MPKHLIPIVATVFVMLFVWLSMAPLLSWYEFGHYAEELDEARLKWSDSGVSDYSYVYEISSYYAPPLPGPLRVTVRDGQLSSSSLVEDGKVIDISAMPAVPGTIELAFDFISTLLAEYPYEINVEYDAVLGYPRRIMVDTSESTADEVTYFIRSFEGIPDGP
ncbi:MAG: hypothetical protein DRR11_13290 [Gammaproteobacteria bacterium]|nr:MAG: hypothetical protein DRR11_13290 [Gammaproteobacteria bacterium]RLA35733.1 MAG: hypothetical protein DRR15_06705 [Gammaproteobacteria bacterium]